MRVSERDHMICSILYSAQTSFDVGDTKSMTLVELLASIVSTTIDSGVFAVVASATALHASWPFRLRLSLLHVGLVSLSILPTSKSHEMPIICLI